jgi:Ca2+-binding RTX toxin-like protein
MTRKTAASLAALALGLLLTTGSALAALIRCKGGACRGTEQADDMPGLPNADQIFSLGGDDQVTATSGNDRVNCGAGNDLISGESGNDRLDGGTGAGQIIGGEDADILIGGSGNDTIDAAAGDTLDPVRDKVFCDSGFDRVTADRIDKVAADCEQVTRVSRVGSGTS